MTSNTQVPYNAFRSGLFQCFYGSVGSEDLINLVLPLHVMQLPEVEMIGLKILKAFFQKAH